MRREMSTARVVAGGTRSMTRPCVRACDPAIDVPVSAEAGRGNRRSTNDEALYALMCVVGS